MNRHFVNIVAAALFFTACYTSCKDKTIEVSGITLSAGSSVTMKEGDQIPLTVVIEPTNATYQNVSWSSSDETVAKVVSRVLHAYKAGTATITAKAGNRTATCNVTVEAEVTYTYSIGASPASLPFGALMTGYTQPDAQTVTITNTGTGAVTLDALPAVANYTLTALSATTLAAGATATFTVRPNAGLGVGTYNPTFDVTGTNGVSATISPTFLVSATTTYSINVSPNNPSFGSLQTPYEQPDAQTVTITNNGTGAVTLDALPAVPNYTLGTLSATTLAAGATATFTIRPNASLPADEYNPTITITGSNGASATLAPTFTVTAPVIPENPGSGLPEDLPVGDL